MRYLTGVLILAFILIPLAHVNAESSSPIILQKWGGKGVDEGKLSNPGSVAVDSKGNIYVADTNNNRIQKFAGP